MPSEGNGVRISNKEIYEEVVALRKEVAAMSERLSSISTQVKLLWAVNIAIIGAFTAAGVKVFSS